HTFGIEEHETPIGCHQELIRSNFQKIIHIRVGQALSCPEVCKAIAVEPRQALSRAEPQKATGVFDYLIDFIIGQARGRCVRSERQPLSENDLRKSETNQPK